MIAALVISILSCALMILSVLFKPTLKLGRRTVDSYWVIVLLGAVAMVVSGQVSLATVRDELLADTAINPLKILVLFISMTVLSIFLDEVGFFSYLASATLRRAKASQYKMFFYLYGIVSLLTVFTSNDIIILTFTPFICYFAKNAKISPLPYLIAEFVAANTWSMALIIGNPTNIYLATANGIGFVEYMKTMLLPTVGAGVVACAVLFLLFYRKLSEPIGAAGERVCIEDRVLLVIGLVHLALCTVMLAISYYVGFEMWYVALGFAVSLFVSVVVASLVRKKPMKMLKNCLSRAPWQLIPFVLSMVVLIIGLSQNGVTAKLTELLGEDGTVLKYGVASFLSANIINNIPMSILYCSVIAPLSAAARTGAVYATVIGSNVGAFLTPIGALAGIMWSSILKKHGVKFNFLAFVRYGVLISVPTLLAALLLVKVLL